MDFKADSNTTTNNDDDALKFLLNLPHYLSPGLPIAAHMLVSINTAGKI